MKPTMCACWNNNELMKYKYVSPTLAFCNQMLLLVLAGLCYYTYTHSCQLAKNYDKQIFSLIINKLDAWRHFTFCCSNTHDTGIHYTYCVRQKNKFLGWHQTPSPSKRYLKVAILCIIDGNNNNNVPENLKFRDNSGTRALPGQRLAFRDCPGHSGTVGTYMYVHTHTCTCMSLCCVILFSPRLETERMLMNFWRDKQTWYATSGNTQLVSVAG